MSKDDIVNQDDKDKVINAKKKDKILTILLAIAILVLVLVIVVKMFVLTNMTVMQSSMEPTFHEKDIIWVYKMGKPERGEVVVFDLKENAITKQLIKRVVATEGDKLWWEESSEEGRYELHIFTADTNKEITENYYKKGKSPVNIPNTTNRGIILARSNSLETAYTVPKDCFFAMGDNREVSNDCRAFGEINITDLVGTVLN
ncbi:MAG: signal peptidase I [Clostridia bacterium]